MADGTQPAPKRQIGVLEMLEYVKGLGIEPVHESEMLWIAEEAFNAQLPPTWSEHMDDQGRTYFHNIANGESSWKHPMDDLFREIVGYHRQVMDVGGFWHIEDELADLEEQIRADLADWMELFDEHREKFYYNRSTDESRFDDPRNVVYHQLYARIKMVAKMKERMPLLARAPRPEDQTKVEEQEAVRRQQELEKYTEMVIKVQSFIRRCLTRKRARAAAARKILGRGKQPLRGRLRLRIEQSGGQRELVLGETTPHRKNKAAIRIQANIRGKLARRRFEPLLEHYTFTASAAKKIQRQARVWLKRKADARFEANKVHVAATLIQKAFRGRKARKFCRSLTDGRRRFDELIAATIKCQSALRMFLAKRVAQLRRVTLHSRHTITLQRFCNAYLAKTELHRCKLIGEPLTFGFLCQTGPAQKSMPFAWTLSMAAMDQRTGSNLGTKLNSGYGDCNLFLKEGPASFETMLLIKVQARLRGSLLRARKRRSKAVAEDAMDFLVRGVGDHLVRRWCAATKIQARCRGILTRKQDWLTVLFERRMQAATAHMLQIQPFFVRYTAQRNIVMLREELEEEWAAVHVQRHYRGRIARKRYASLCEEAVWPLKGWFEYTATGADSCKVEVQFLTNPRFDGWKFFSKFGALDVLDEQLGDMQREVRLIVGKHTYSAKVAGQLDDLMAEANSSATVSIAGEDAESVVGDNLSSPQKSGSVPPSGRGSSQPSSRSAPLSKGASNTGSGKASQRSGKGSGKASAQASPKKMASSRPPPVPEPAPIPGMQANEDVAALPLTPAVEELADASASSGTGEQAELPPAQEPVSPGKSKKLRAPSPPKPPPAPEKPGTPKAAAAMAKKAAKMGHAGGRALGVLSAAAYDIEDTSHSKVPSLQESRRQKSVEHVPQPAAKTIHDLSEEDRQNVLLDLAEQRRLKVEDLMRRQQKHQAKQHRAQRREVSELQASTSVEFLPQPGKAGRRPDSLRRQRKAMSPVDFEARAARKSAALEGSDRGSMDGSQSGSGRQQRMLHRHVHHHVHYHDVDEVSPEQSAVSWQGLVPPLASSPGATVGHGGTSLRRSASERDARHMMDSERCRLAPSASAGQLPPPLGGSPLIRQGLRGPGHTQELFQAHALARQRVVVGPLMPGGGSGGGGGAPRKVPFQAPVGAVADPHAFRPAI